MTDRYSKFAMQVHEMSALLEARKKLMFVFNECARRLAHMDLKPDEYSWIRQTQGTFAKEIVSEIKTETKYQKAAAKNNGK